MNIVGMYQVSSLLGRSGDSLKMITREERIAEVNASDADPREKSQQLMTANSRLEICNDGKIYSYAPIPEGVPADQIQAAVDAGQVLKVKDGYCVFGKGDVYDWKEEDGKFFYDTRQTREILGEAVSPWDDLKFDGTHVTFAEGFVIYEKIN